MGENVLKFGTYVRVGNAAEAYELLQKNRNNKIVGGGIWMRLGSRRVATAVDLSACGLDQIEETETEFRIGAMCTLRQLERHAELNALVNNVFEFAVHDIVGVQLRNTATVGGSIYGRFGFSDVLSAFLALDSYVELTGAGRVPLAEFVNMGYVRDVIEHVVVVKYDYRASYEAVRKAATDFPSLNVTAAWWDNSWHVTVGARPLRATLLQGEACGLVNEQPSEDELRALAASVRALSYGTNLWGSADYRRRISAPLAIQAVRRAAGIELSAALARKVKVQIAPDTMLFALLREQGCASVRCACETTNCGLCTVWLDGDPVLSCSVPAARVEGHTITTLEGLKAESEALARAMASEGAEQCGFCAPGLIMNVLALARAAKEDPSLVASCAPSSASLTSPACRWALRCPSCRSTTPAAMVSPTSRSPTNSPRRTRRPCSRAVPSTRAIWCPPARSSLSSSAARMPAPRSASSTRRAP